MGFAGFGFKAQGLFFGESVSERAMQDPELDTYFRFRV